jgi:hypothetical protein
MHIGQLFAVRRRDLTFMDTRGDQRSSGMQAHRKLILELPGHLNATGEFCADQILSEDLAIRRASTDLAAHSTRDLY